VLLEGKVGILGDEYVVWPVSTSQQLTTEPPAQILVEEEPHVRPFSRLPGATFEQGNDLFTPNTGRWIARP
jgi:hypothetical protein